MSTSLLLAFWGVAALLIAVPGPDWAFTLASSAREATALPAVGGLMAGYVLLTGLVAAGVGALVVGAPGALAVLTVGGAAYLLHLGVRLVKDPGELELAHPGPDGGTPWWTQAVRGAGVSSLNPKALLLFLALLPQFTDPAAGWPVPAQVGALGAVYITTCGLFYTAIGTGARTLAARRPGALRAIPRLSGAAMVALGLAMLGQWAVGLG